ncbi:hypothetical protein A2962_03570 [Candidatus Woesebacteria bacterium RIFCSPLOWO2_01_FULL_39_61]|uniref:ATPase F1/V1/A1 complex alpha/beta subunit nucleotide-binding domain-containing protein n=1 Tax=Candidatus Woesebacteria bacterium RIFCSPHIGHO2_02_FULL_39_13 TaxID=1802505 RepID=A0A1F7Z3Z4_9BACT|nr:MAG: hypothetical protein A2692_00700 [Candidatus Woesebacteria bacterium RIFCSPHIGHO2_01_FULL_39_95]OGM34130.1 MAG: hypothetical protein A3D01_00155 [Candidatus Woesebacteria bacterium RIFCSPHIGHO2_02_FULL_39_13]OGM38729.1 MAG: hypothetical protein A3E13_03890 [Candidatus Woesebacteria bacterium RIFCSPHIGHO2_12_FULL_40_20]OGM67590.1 MAG: hypothetical protein A2962_03570 [Candidatus Woesebacteria bacterium RIFCSPLOWO2_01_FULL_39_61]
MKDFDYYLNKIGEIGFVDEIVHSIAYVSGIPSARPSEVVIFEGGEVGTILSLSPESAEVLLLSRQVTKVGNKVARTGDLFQVAIGSGLLGRVVDPLAKPIDSAIPVKDVHLEPIDTQPHGIIGREPVKKPLETGVTLVDLVVPLGKGQRELIIGDRKTGKTEFLLQTIYSQATKGTICIYALIGQKQVDIKKRQEFLEDKKIMDKCIIVASSSSDPSGLIYLTPYTSMTIAEHFRDQGLDVLLILDDMTTHARYYREISLLARRFPGRDSYPGDIFYIHARLIERAGNYKRGSITCLPAAESVLGDLSGYVQTNLMAMTDGHVFFDIELYNQGKRPAVNPELSVTRVGHQAQTPLQRDLSRELMSFLVNYQRMQQFMHFGAEAGETVKSVLRLGAKVDEFFSQRQDEVIAINVNILILAGLWGGIWKEIEGIELKREMEQIVLTYQTDPAYKAQVDQLISSSPSFTELVQFLRQNDEIIVSKIRR